MTPDLTKPMSAETKAKIENDLMLYGNAFARLVPDGGLEHLDARTVVSYFGERAEGDYSAFTTKQLEAEVKRRRGFATLTIDEIDAQLDTLELGQIGALRRRVNALWEQKSATCVQMTDEEKAMIQNREYINTVKSIRARLNVGLADAKALLDKWTGKGGV